MSLMKTTVYKTTQWLCAPVSISFDHIIASCLEFRIVMWITREKKCMKRMTMVKFSELFYQCVDELHFDLLEIVNKTNSFASTQSCSCKECPPWIEHAVYKYDPNVSDMSIFMINNFTCILFES